MPLRYRNDQRLSRHSSAGQIVEVAERHPEERGVKVAGTQLRSTCLVVLRGKGELDQWMRSPEPADNRRRHAPIRTVRVGKAHPALATLPGLTHEGDGVIGVFEDASCRGDEHAAWLGELDPATRAVEELDAQLLFEPPDLLAQRWLRDVLPLRSATEMQFVSDREEVAQLA